MLGPICYGKGSKNLAVTDANLFLGRIIPKYFPFKLDVEATKNAMEARTKEVNNHPNNSEKQLSSEEVAFGYIRIANSKMSDAIKKVTEAKGFDIVCILYDIVMLFRLDMY